MNVRPLHDRIIVRRLEQDAQRTSGIIIPDTAKEKPQQGTVVAAGNGRSRDDGTRIALDVKKGDLILFGKYAGQEVELDGKPYLIMKEDEVLAVRSLATSHRVGGAAGRTARRPAVIKGKTKTRKRRRA